MTTLLDLLYVACFAVAGPLFDHFVFWPAFRRRSHADPARARRWLWAWAVGPAWAPVAVGAALWMASDRSWASFGFAVPHGWRLWAAVAVFLLLAGYHVLTFVALARDPGARASVRRQLGPLTAVMPHTRTELYRFAGVAVTAGICEEFLYRGYFIRALAPWLGWWGAAALSLACFAIPHAHVYQGWSGVIRTGVVGAVYTLIVAITDSLWPAIVLHVTIDLGAGIMAWLALGEGSANGDRAYGAQPADTRAAT